MYFHLVNVAEERHRARALRAADQVDRPISDTVGAAVAEVARLHGPAQAQSLLSGLEFRPVLTAHPTEARRRAVVTGIRRVAELLERRDDPRLGASEEAEIRRRLLEEVDILWRTAQLRADRPGPVSATFALYDAQARLAAWASRHAIRLTLFHGRGGARGRGGGPANRAVLAQAPGSVAGRFKVTEQGEVFFARYGDPVIARRHIEQVAAAVLLASTPAVEDRAREAAEEFADLATVLDKAAREAYHDLVCADGFADWFAQVTPLEEIGALRLGSRPARRGQASSSSLEDLRAIPWVFSWAQTRVNLPGWYGLGTGFATVGDPELLRRAYESWPLFTVMLENAEMSLAKTDRRIAGHYLDLGGRPDLTERVLDEHARTTSQVLALSGHARLLEDRRVLGRAVALRDPYVDALSHLQVRALRALRDGTADDAGIRRLLQITVNGIAAGLQNTG